MLMLATALVLMLGFINISAANKVSEGSCGENASYIIYDDGTLEINGYGKMYDYTNNAPWVSFSNEIKSVNISQKITSLGSDAFLGLNVKSINIPSSVQRIGTYAVGYFYNIAAQKYQKYEQFEISGSVDSVAEQYAKDNGFEFLEISSETGGKCGSNASWSLSSDGVLTVFGSGEMENYKSADAPWSEKNFSSVIISEGITSVGENSFFGCQYLSSVSIPNSISSIGDMAFYGCTALAEIKFEGNLTSIGNEAFAHSGLKSVSLPDISQNVGTGLFSDCSSLQNAYISNLNSIPDYTFMNCEALVNVVTSENLISIGKMSFHGCSSLASFNFTKQITTVSQNAFSLCTNLLTVSLPDSLTKLGQFAFYGCTNLSKITIGNGLNSIEKGTFESCSSLSDIELGLNLTTIGERAFTNCSSLNNINIPTSVKNIFDNSIGYFYSQAESQNEIIETYSKNTEFVIEISSFSPSVAEIYSKENGFLFKSLGTLISDTGRISDTLEWSINISSGIIVISGNGTMPDFEDFSKTPWSCYKEYIKTISVSSGVTGLGAHCFSGCVNISEIILSKTVSSIGSYAFAGTGIVNLSLSQGLTRIGISAFENCTKLSNVVFPSSLEGIGESAFKNTPSLKSVYIPSSVKNIDMYALGYDYEYKVYPDFYIRGEKGSIAESYAENNGITFKKDGYTEITDEISGCTLSVVGLGNSNYILTLLQDFEEKNNKLFVSVDEYAIFNKISLTLDDREIIPNSTVNITLPIPKNVNPISAKIFYCSETGVYSEIDFFVENNKFVFSHSNLGYFVITNANLNELYTITAEYKLSDGTELFPSDYYKATKNASYEIFAKLDENYSVDKKIFTGNLEGQNIVVSFLYTKASAAPSGPSFFQKSSTLFLVIGIIAAVCVAGLIIALLIFNKKRSSFNKNSANDDLYKISDIKVIPDAAPTKEIDIKSLFPDDPEEDVEKTKDIENS